MENNYSNMRNLERKDTNELIYKNKTYRNRFTDVENELMVTRGEGWGKEIGSLERMCTHCYI